MPAAEKIALAVNGAAGKMGRRLVSLIVENPKYLLAGAFEREGHPDLGKDAGFVAGCARTGIVLKTLNTSERVMQALIDFSSPDGAMFCVQTAQAISRPAVICTTALTPDQEKKVRAAAKKIAVVYAPNMSLGMNLLLHLAEEAARFMGQAYDVEIVEVHHRQKKDAPSGSATALADSIRRGRGSQLEDVHGRSGVIGPRSAGELGLFALRGGDVVGDHTVHFLGLGERLELTHRATTRDTFAAGAIRAAQWALDKPAGLYGMRDILGLPSGA